MRIASGMKTALALAKEDQFDLLVSDIGLPDGSGLDLMRELSSQYKMQGVAVSGFGMPQDIADCRAAGFCRYVLKPATFEELHSAIQKCLPRTNEVSAGESTKSHEQAKNGSGGSGQR